MERRAQGCSSAFVRGKREMAHDPKVRQTHAIPPSADPAEAIERLVSRRHLRVETGDVVVTRIHGSKSLPRESYELQVMGGTDPRERFATFEHAATRGELLAIQR